MPTSNAEWLRSELNKLHPYWYSPIDLGHGVNTKPSWFSRRRFTRRLRLLQIPENLAGKRALDVGTWDGYFALELERRGAEVVAIDLWNGWNGDNALKQFEFALRVKNSKISYKRMDVHDVSPEVLGKFDLVLCAGVLYHTRHPFLALERLRSVTDDMLILDTVTMIPAFHGSSPMIMFFPGDQEVTEDQKQGNVRKWGICAAPTLPWIYDALHSAGFTRIQIKYRPSFSWFKRMVALFKNQPQGGRSVTHAFTS